MAAAASGSWSMQAGVAAALLFAMGLWAGHLLQPGSGAGGPPPPRLVGDSADRFHQAPCPPPRQPGTQRRNLVFAAVGDGWSADKWSYTEQSSWDLVAVYYGNRTDWDCPKCMLALTMADSMKWQMVWRLMTSKDPRWEGIWGKLRRSYDFVLVTDDDLIMDSCTIDILFQTMRRHKLLVAQPSNCRGKDSDNPYAVHWQLPGLEMHYVNIVEVTAPALSMKFLDTEMRPYLQRSYSGWALPFCFWAATRFSHQRMGAVDAACMIHPARQDVGRKMIVSERIRRGLVKPGSIYARFGELTPFKTPKAEQLSVWAECGFTADRAPIRTPLMFDSVLAEPQAAAAEAGTALWGAGAAEQRQRQRPWLSLLGVWLAVAAAV
ncbi:Adenosylmethionine-8-amino-7-oxononanoate aminotransferase [Micractinium conductrix]|uniref:Adenosylmethionine-8-amino-7-oxononanoate aminotransferase n=1 Tax=Micractinium conductrix TaxID=554055 RepID=A0A2P6V2S8_9CHLO|nr:Adenosylmethionine-8-amino-7-oxononanoate aminotransferase [Micractinium conductrix]|eukprot:PSC68400.1 Adenosylmethionine-8-amino-7-oxononanoate aminotransferase [Micractinium conductrix]